MTKKLNYILLAICLFSLPFLANGQETRKIGLSASLQSSQIGILLPIWLGNSFTLAPTLDVRSTEGVGTDLIIGLVPKLYFKTEGIAPFISARFGAAFNFPSEENIYAPTEKTTDIIGGLGFGAEYFFNPNFSAGVEAQGNFTKSGDNSLRFGSPGALSFNTATAATINIFF